MKRGCYLCRRELAEFEKLIDQLALAVSEARPPAELKSRLMERIQGASSRRSDSEA